MNRNHHSTHQILGFTLVEVLIALVILAVGMLGIAALLLNSLQSSRLALLRTQAVTLTSDMGDRIRANRAAGSAYALVAGSALSSPTKQCTTAGQCNAADVAAIDLYRWQQSVLTALPGAQTSIVVAPVGSLASNTYTITITWTQAGDGMAGSFALTVQA